MEESIKRHLLATLERKEKYIEIIKMLTDEKDSDLMNLLFSKTLQCERDIKGFYIYLNEIENENNQEEDIKISKFIYRKRSV